MKKISALLVITLLFALQLAAQNTGVTLMGRVLTNGNAVAGAQLTLTNQTTARVYKLKTGANGGFTAVGVAPGNDFTVEVFNASGESLFRRTGVSVPAQSSPINWTIDVINDPRTDIGGIKATPRQPQYTAEQIAEMKRQNERAQAENTLITQAINAINAKDFQTAVPPLQQLIQMDPDRYEFYQSLGDAQLSLGQYEQAAATYQKAITLAQNTAPDAKNPATDPAKIKGRMAAMLTNEGNAYLKLHKNKEAVDAFTQAASLDPNPATAYFNLCATQYNAGNFEGAIGACDKAIQYNPNKADAYFIKGSLLVAEAKLDAQGRMIAPPGAAEALNKYLELEPNGPRAQDCKEMLAAIGAKIETTYKKKGK